MKSKVFEYIKAGFGAYVGWTVAKCLDIRLGELITELKRKSGK